MHVVRLTMQLAIGLLLGPCAVFAVQVSDEIGPEPSQVMLETVVAHPDRYQGKPVSVTAAVAHVFGPRLFTLQDDKVWSSGEQLLVLNPRPAGRVERGTHVTVAGILTRLSPEGLPSTVLPTAGDALSLSKFVGQPILKADSIFAMDGPDLVAPVESTTPTQSDGSPDPSG